MKTTTMLIILALPLVAATLHSCNVESPQETMETNMAIIPDYLVTDRGDYIIPIKIPKLDKETEVLYPQNFIMWKLRQDRSAESKFYKEYAMDNTTFLDSVLAATSRLIKPYNKITHAEMLISFVQHIPYVSDKEIGYRDRPLFPIETIFLNGGDCEDQAILLFGLLNRLGIETVFVQFPNHVMVASCWENCEGYYVESNRRRYFLIETTAPGEIGKQPSGKCMNCYSIIHP